MWFQKSSGSKTLSRAVIQATNNNPTRGNMTGDRTDYGHGQKSCSPCMMTQNGLKVQKVTKVIISSYRIRLKIFWSKFREFCWTFRPAKNNSKIF